MARGDGVHVVPEIIVHSFVHPSVHPSGFPTIKLLVGDKTGDKKTAVGMFVLNRRCTIANVHSFNSFIHSWHDIDYQGPRTAKPMADFALGRLTDKYVKQIGKKLGVDAFLEEGVLDR